VAGGRVEFFSDSSGQGRIYEGSVTADGEGWFSWNGNPIGPNLTATVTDPEGNTSEFSAPVSISGVEGKDRSVPRAFSPSQNFPNPFNGITTIRFQVPEPGRVVLRVFDVRGREVARILDGKRGPGEYEVTFNASGFGSGIYYVRMETGENRAVRKMVFLE
jgi:hypothetical protein